MKNLFVALCLISLIACHKDDPATPPATAHAVTPNPPPDTTTVFFTAEYINPYNPNIMYWMIYDSVIKPIDTGGHYRYVSQFIGNDSLPNPIVYANDSAITYIFSNHQWNRVPIGYTSFGHLFTDSIYSWFQEGNNKRAYIMLRWQSNSYNVNTYIHDTMYFKVFVKPSNSNL